ncbi:hypothetical protein [Ferrimonas balearica]|uniref:hypothetical protein n=1 Tax=Ferrimonas balearica TaxID=44012 RepID=UPI001C94DB36|nr:hypothetical protein [Ferrimonas balearica]MBY6223593.1 hypothetical protein [Ferrimonas balearica]
MTTLIQRAWQWVQSQSSFTSAELGHALGVTPWQAQRLLESLQRKNAVLVDSQTQRHQRLPGARLNLPGLACKSQSKPLASTGQQRAWQSMRILRRFGLRDLVATADISYSTARNYVAMLAQYGYLKRSTPAAKGPVSRGRAGCYNHYLLLKDTGPIAPQRSKTGLYDRNLDQELRHVELD